MAPSRRTVLTTGAAGLVTAAAAAHAQTTGQGSLPQPMRPRRGGTDPGPRNVPIEMQNPDIFIPPTTDAGTLPNLQVSRSSTSHMRLERGGWTREITVRELGISKEIAGVDMRLNAGGVRELHWHKEAEWAYMLYGRARITAIDEEGRSFSDDLGVGDLWYFPPGLPHSIQGLEPGRLRVPAGLRRRQLQRGQHVPAQRLVRAHAAGGAGQELRRAGVELRATCPTRTSSTSSRARCRRRLQRDRINGAVPMPHAFSHRLLAQKPIRTKSGTVRIVDSRNFPASRRRSRPRWSRSIRAACASCTGTRTRTSGSTTSRARRRMGVFASTGNAAHLRLSGRRREAWGRLMRGWRTGRAHTAGSDSARWRGCLSQCRRAEDAPSRGLRRGPPLAESDIRTSACARRIMKPATHAFQVCAAATVPAWHRASADS